MRPLWKDILAALWLGMILPGITLNAFVLKDRHHQTQRMDPVQTEQIREPEIPVRDPDALRIYMPLNHYLTGVLLAEMPADFHPEALKAQAAAARTYTWKAFTTGGKHGDGSVCTDSACCQAYIPEERYLSHGGTRECLDKVRQAVWETASMVIAYDGQLIEATYFSSSGGSTESALAVWGTDYPYLQSVSSPETEHKEVTLIVTPEEFQNLLGKTFHQSPAQWFGPVTYTSGGGVDTIEICGETYTGLQLRSLLGLRSTIFQIQMDGENMCITSRGYGHRVGMSQYGADAMAEAGKTWQQILQHYYPGTTLYPICVF